MSLVYSTDRGRICPDCGRAMAECRCATDGQAAVPDRIVAKLRIDKQGRAGKTVTVVYGLPHNAQFLKALCHDLKKACGTGGSTGDGSVEVQGDQRDRLRQCLRAKGFLVKG